MISKKPLYQCGTKLNFETFIHVYNTNILGTRETYSYTISYKP